MNNKKSANNLGGVVWGVIGGSLVWSGLSLVFARVPQLPPLCPGVVGMILVVVGVVGLLYAMEVV